MMTKLWGAVVLATLAACGGGSGGGNDGGSPSGSKLVVPDVPAGARETACQALCKLAAGDTICTATHAQFCLARCRASTNGLPAGCADCVLSTGAATPIEGYTIGSDSYCHVGGAGELTACAKECDDGAGQPFPDLEPLCQVACGFYLQDPKPFACAAADDADCFSACRATIAAKGRACAQCMIEQTIPGRSCFNDACQCLNMFPADAALSCEMLCDGVPPA